MSTVKARDFLIHRARTRVLVLQLSEEAAPACASASPAWRQESRHL